MECRFERILLHLTPKTLTIRKVKGVVDIDLARLAGRTLESELTVSNEEL